MRCQRRYALLWRVPGREAGGSRYISGMFAPGSGIRFREGVVIKMKLTGHGKLKRLLALGLAGCMGLSLAACGGEERPEPVREWVYVPEFQTIEDERAFYYDMQYHDGGLYYSSDDWDQDTEKYTQNLCRYSLTDKSVSRVPLDWGEYQADNRNIQRMQLAPDGGIYAVVQTYVSDDPYGNGETYSGLAAFGADGKIIFYEDVTETLKNGSQGDYIYIDGFAVDGRSNIYVSMDSTVFLFDSRGGYQGSVTAGSGMESRIQYMGAGRDGKIYAVTYSWSGEGSSQELVEIDFDNKKTGTSYADFPRGSSENLTPGTEDGTFLVNDGRAVYEYRLADQTKKELFNWLDSDINGSSVRSMNILEDGRILAVIMDWESDDRGIALLTRKKGSEVAHRETILIGTMSSGSDLQAAAVRFNRSSDKYRISIRQYMDYDSYSQESYQDAINNLNNDLLSRSNCPDIIALSGLNIKLLASKGLLEDLGKYLDKSESLSREDFVESVLNAYTYDGVLVGIPTSIEMHTIVGRASDMGDRRGWTLKELMDYSAKHPGADLFDKVDRNSLLSYLMMYNEDAFIDWGTGRCSFDTEEFKALLSFVSGFPEKVEHESGQASEPTRIQKGEVLLAMASLYDFDQIQLYNEIFEGDFTCIGFPSAGGDSGTAMMGSNLYAITSKATRKDGAWEFLEKYLQNYSDRYSFGFPTLKSKLKEMAEDAVRVEYLKDENGALIMDENGETIVIGAGGGIGYGDGWHYDYRKATQEEVDLTLSLLEDAKPISYSNNEIVKIISEEAAYFFEGAKSVDEVAKIIQSRIQTFVDTNR